MNQSIRKITFSAPKDQILDKAKSEAITQDICDELAAIRWVTVVTGQPIEPPAETVAVIVDLTIGRGAVRFYDKTTDSPIDGVYMAGPSQTLIPWNNRWSFRVSGSPGIAYIESAQKDNTIT